MIKTKKFWSRLMVSITCGNSVLLICKLPMLTLSSCLTWSSKNPFLNQFSSVPQSSLTLCDPMDCSMPDFPAHHQLPETTQNLGSFPNFSFYCFPLSLHWSLRKASLSFLAILWNSPFRWVYLSFFPLPLASLLFSAICKDSSDNHTAFFHFIFEDGLDHWLYY